MRFVLIVFLAILGVSEAKAGDILNLDNVEHQVVFLGKDASRAPISLQPNQRIQLPAADVAVQLPSGAHPASEYHIEQRDVWVIWSKGEFGMQLHRKVSSSQW